MQFRKHQLNRLSYFGFKGKWYLCVCEQLWIYDIMIYSLKTPSQPHNLVKIYTNDHVTVVVGVERRMLINAYIHLYCYAEYVFP